MSLLSTYKPTELGRVERSILYYFVENEHISAYDIFKDFVENKFSKPISYKNIHKRVKRLEQLNLIQLVDENFDRGAKHYKITPYGLTSFLSNFTSEDANYIQLNKNNIVIKSLLLEYFEEETIDSFYALKDDNTSEISDYLRDCCSLIKNTCSKIWNEIEKYNIKDILPEDKIIQKYMIYLDERPIEHYAIKEIEQYKSRLSNRLLLTKEEIISKNIEFNLNYDHYLRSKYGYSIRRIKEAKKDPTKITEEPPFPLNYIYSELDYLDYLLYQKVRSLAISLVNMIGYSMEVYAPEYEIEIEKYLREKEKSIGDQQNRYEREIKMNLDLIESSKKQIEDDKNIIDGYEKNKTLHFIRHMEEENLLYKKNIDPHLEDKRPIDLILDDFGRDYSMRRMMEDKKLLELIKDIKKLFDLGYEQFIKLSK
jgi:hypothetical protein